MFKQKLKSFLRLFLPKSIRMLLWNLIPKLYLVNTYLLKKTSLFEPLSSISDKYYIKEIGWDDEEKLKKIYSLTSTYESKIPRRLNASEWVGLAVIDKTNGDIAYLAWVIKRSIKYFEEFGIYLKPYQFLLKDGYCVPEYRHQGLHTRMEQERINYCIENGASEIFIQIHDSNKKGHQSVIDNGYMLYQKNYIIQWPIFNVYRSFKGFLRNPFRKVVK